MLIWSSGCRNKTQAEGDARREHQEAVDAVAYADLLEEAAEAADAATVEHQVRRRARILIALPAARVGWLFFDRSAR